MSRMICSGWRGWTTLENAAAYESVVRGKVIPGIEALRIEVLDRRSQRADRP